MFCNFWDLFLKIVLFSYNLELDLAEALDQTTTAPEYQPCKTPSPPTNGSVSMWGNALLVEFTCDEGLFPIGRSFGSCNPVTKRWSTYRPLCVSTACDPPSNLTNGRTYFDHEGGVVIATCNQGFKLIGNRKRHCDGYSWRGLTPKCRDMYKSQSGRRQAANDNITTTSSPHDVALDILETDVLDADNTCYHDFSEPPIVEHALMDIVYRFNSARHQWILIANYTCEDGYSFRDILSTYLYCKRYKWTGKTDPVCVNSVLPPQNPCETDNGRCAHICVPRLGTRYNCECRSGYALGRFRRKCYDIDECKLDNGGCVHTCINIPGSFFCICEHGYVASGQNCLDLDECNTPGGHLCSGECINTQGDYTCNCIHVGFTQAIDGKSCLDFDECQVNNGNCEDVCINTIGSYRCICRMKGYRLADDTTSCIDIDECRRYGKKRCANGICENIPGSYICRCHAGFQETHSRKKCIDINECTGDSNVCVEVCDNVPGSYSCGCHGNGYRIGIDGTSCFDINECEVENGNCNDTCINTPGSYECFCQQDYQVLHVDGHSCTTCDRYHYYDKISGPCAPCPPNTVVKETVTVATCIADCICKQGFIMGDGSTHTGVSSRGSCNDINECEDDILQCDQICINTPGSAHCQCLGGYNLTMNTTCTDKDECSVAPCSQNCENLPGSYICICYDGYYLTNDQHYCADIEECIDDVLLCEHECVNTLGGAYCTCSKGYELREDNVTCKDMDECELGSHLCEDKCLNTRGSYLCDCIADGLKLSWDLASCSDMNECMEGENRCNGDCINTYGSYTCTCDATGFVASQDRTTCEDVDECANLQINVCQQTCINTPGSYRCDCFPGHALVGFNQCAACPRNYYRDDSSVECVSCPHNSETSGEGSVHVTDCHCIGGYYGNVTVGEDCSP